MPRLVAAACALLMLTACTQPEALVVYSGRSEDLIGPLIKRFTEETGIAVRVRWGESAELATTIILEGDRSPADVFLAQDPATLGLVDLEGRFSALPQDLLDAVPAPFRDREGAWVGISGRARVLVYDPRAVVTAELPASVRELTSERWSGSLGIAPTNGSFLAFVAAMIILEGEKATLTWLREIAANSPTAYPKNSPIVDAVDRGEMAAGLVNHYYLLRRQAEQGSVEAVNHYFTSGGAGSLVMPSGAGILASSDKTESAEEFIRFLLSEEAQLYFATQTFEYPMVPGIPPPAGQPPLESITTPNLDLSTLAIALQRATELVAEAGLI